jgi:ribosomal protein L19
VSQKENPALNLIDKIGALLLDKGTVIILIGILGVLTMSLADNVQDYFDGTTTIDGDSIIVEKRGWIFVLNPVMPYIINGEVVGKDNYYFDGAYGLISPVDLGLAWGYVMMPEYKNAIDFSMKLNYRQLVSTYHSSKNDIPLSSAYIITHTSNNHIIPANREVKKAIGDLKVGDRVKLVGRLVNVVGKKKEDVKNNEGVIMTLETSVVRDDYGSWGCEVFFVEKVIKLEKNKETFILYNPQFGQSS